MPIFGNKHGMNLLGIVSAPDAAGVYALLEWDELIYYGRALNSIRDRLEAHRSGSEGPCTQRATHFLYEVCFNPAQREVDLLSRHKATFGRLPRCNERIG